MMFRSLIVACILFFSSAVHAGTQCSSWANTDNKPMNHLVKTGVNASVQVTYITGAGAFSVQLQESNTGGTGDIGWFDNGSAITTAPSLTKVTTANAQFVRVKLIASPPAGTTIHVCVFADGIGEQ